VFTKDALALIAECSEGIPRNINNLCFNALSLGCALQQKPIDRYVIREVVADLDLGAWRKKNSGALHPEEKNTPNAPAIFSAATPSTSAGMFAGWLPKVAAVVVVLLAVSGALFEGYRWLSRPVAAQPAAMASVAPDAGTSAQQDPSPVLPNPVVSGDSPASVVDPPSAVQANSPAQPAISRTPYSSTSTADRTSQPGDSAGVVLVTPGRTLLGICVEKFGTCTPELLQQIHELNPSLSNPDHIETGQKIRIPVLAAQSNGSGQAQ
jgi:hypothetical protein